MDKLLAVKENAGKITHIHVYTSYNKGGYNYFTYKPEKRGYSLHVQPEQRGNGCVSCCPMDGVKTFLVECGRKSKNAEAKADALAVDNEKKLLDYVCARCNIELA